MANTNLLRTALLASVALCFVVEDAAAQIEEILVTVRKREESLQEIPLSITAFDAAALERNRIQTIDDLAKYTPGLVFDRGFVPQDTRPQIRGLFQPHVDVLRSGFSLAELTFRPSPC